MKEIPLSQGKVALVDDEDFGVLVLRKWHANRTQDGKWYARSGTYPNQIYMHRIIMEAYKGEQIDHVNGDGLDNRRKNLRFATSLDQSGNKRKAPYKSSQYKGVCFDKSRNKWVAHIHINGKQKHLGRFLDEEEAALAYDEAAKEHFGEFALTNFN